MYTDGTVSFRLFDFDIPVGSSAANIQSITLGTFFGQEFASLGTITAYDDAFVCFVAGTLITTPDGDIPVEKLKVGDLVLILDHGPLPIRWIGGKQDRAAGSHAPVVIRKGALGLGVPTQDLRVSQQHRILVNSKIVHTLFGEREILVAAKKLIGMEGISVASSGRLVDYFTFFSTNTKLYSPTEHPQKASFLGLKL